ncbi:hypothetical protein BDY24DRAFT_398447 [Mrakia frigida]|uniref:uncharacterized protein n=1 Tax=Mrakia frigida TaxID=29902 RepID=UPI003FCC16FA
MDVDMSLDDMIATKPRGGGRRRGGGGPSRGAPAAAAATTLVPVKGTTVRARYAQPIPIAQAAQQTNQRQAQAAANIQAGVQEQEAFKIIISNLPLDVDDNAVKDLFHSTVGPTKDCSLTYDRNGKHKGVATVVFQRRGDAQKAFKTYNNRLIDGRTPMKVEIVYSGLLVAPLASRVAPMAAPVVAPAPVYQSVAVPMSGAPRGEPRVGRGGRSGGRGGRGVDTGRRPTKSQADLDAEMDSFLAEKTA